MEEKSGWNKAFARWGYRERCSSFFCLATPKYTPTAGVCQKRLQDYSRVLQKIKVKPRKAFRALQGFMRVIIGAEGGTRQANEKDSNQQAVLLDKLKEQGSYGDSNFPSDTFTGSLAGSQGAEIMLGYTGNRQSPFLYLKGRIFYYRYKLPKRFVTGGSTKEIRISLRTAYQSQASRIAARLHSLTTESLERWTMAEYSDFDENMKRIEALRKFLQNELDKILDAPGKRELSPSDIRKRLNGYLKYQLDQEAVEPIPPDEIIVGDGDGNFEKVDLAESNDKIASNLLHNLNTGDNFDTDVQRCVFDLVKSGAFDISEVSRDNVDGLTRSYLAMQISLQKIRAARLRGDFSYEQPYHQAEYIPYPQIEMPVEETTIYLSELIEKYCIIKIKDGAWVKRSLSDHKNRVTSLLRIIGDKQIHSIIRKDMRNFRDTLQKLPPRWREQLDKSGLSQCCPAKVR